VTRGQAETVMRASAFIKPNLPLVIFNIDTMFHSPTLKANLLRTDIDGVLGCFYSKEPRFSFAATDNTGRVTRVTEKEAISINALTGLYHFRLAADFMETATNSISENRLTKGEFYVAPLYNELIAKGGHFIVNTCENHWILGTPDEYTLFCQTITPNTK